MPTQLQQSIIEVLTGTRPLFNGGLTDPGFDIERAVLIVNLSPVEVQVTDPMGRNVGIDFSTGEPVDEIHGAFHSHSDLINEPDFIYIPDAMEGTYVVNLCGVAVGQCRVQVQVLTYGGALRAAEAAGTTSPGERHSHTFDYSPQDLPKLPLTLEWRPPLQPGEELPLVNRNSTLPIRFRVHDGSGDFVVDPHALAWIADGEDPSHVVAAFTLEDPGIRGRSDVVRIDPKEEQYVVNVHLRDHDFEFGRTYVVGVLVFGQEVGTTAFTIAGQQAPPGRGRGR